jgi:hypothetical protein
MRVFAAFAVICEINVIAFPDSGQRSVRCGSKTAIIAAGWPWFGLFLPRVLRGSDSATYSVDVVGKGCQPPQYRRFMRSPVRHSLPKAPQHLIDVQVVVEGTVEDDAAGNFVRVSYFDGHGSAKVSQFERTQFD